ncbi:hypothetical protein FSP39_020830 [Pinctada imbricata]|uniref:Protein rolling stone n=1 Tax=Pinctada imbricata TaxID=66713 RepID=A0AA88YL32_PINIB|nr:hypothetical protein FSP39_020830 [Pinctada imbricata]
MPQEFKDRAYLTSEMSLPEKEAPREERKRIPEVIRREFCRNNFGLQHDDPVLFITSQSGPRLFYRIWTTLWAIYHLVVILLQPYFQWSENKLPSALWLVYMTNWGYTVLVTYSILDCIATHYVHIRRKDIISGMNIKMSWYLKFNWVLFNIMTDMALFITILYYGLLTPDFHPDSVLTHLLNTVYIVTNLFVCAKPIRLLHVIYPSLFATIYAIFSVIYQTSGGSAIYPVLDWNKVSFTLPLSIGLVIFALPVMHACVFGMYQLRVYLYRKSCAITKVDAVKTDTKETEIVQTRY